MRGVPLQGLLCVVHNSSLKVHNSSCAYNQMRPFVVGDQADVMLHATNVSNNVADGFGGGVAVQGNASVAITDGSRLRNNSAIFGGGVSAVDNASLTLAGGSSI